jgi:NAD(P)-dependent dehydrogenase (short-subunit alcohol dehydrogenase family)
MYNLDGQVALVTGAAAGIGLGVARRLASEGVAVAMVDRDVALLGQAASQVGQLGAPVLPIVADVSVREDVEAAVASTANSLGPISILVNNAGIWRIKDYLEHTDDDLERQWRVNCLGTHLTMSCALPGMVDRGHGCVVNISSVAAFHYTTPHAAYASSKAAVVAMTRDVAFEVAQYGVRVNGIAPGLISPTAPPGRDVIDRSKAFPMGRGRPADIGGVVAFLASDDARFIVGVTIPVCGGTDLWVSIAFDPAVAAAGRARQKGEA